MKYILLIILTSQCVICFGQSKGDYSRNGFVIGASTGISNIKINFESNDLSQMGLALNWKLGYMITPRTALLLNGAISIYDYELSDRPRLRDLGGLFPSVQYWVKDRYWILAGIGLATDAPVFFDLKTENKEETRYHMGLGVLTGAGLELYRISNFTFEMQARVNYNNINYPFGRASSINSALLFGFYF